MSYESGRSRSYHHGLPTTSETCDAGFMQGYRDGESSRRFQESLYSAPAIPNFRTTTQRPAPQADGPAEPLTLASAVKGFAIAGTLLGVLNAYVLSNGLPATVATNAFVGLMVGMAAGTAVFVAAKVLQFAVWLLTWAVKIAAVSALVYYTWYYLVH